jgi:two-component system chemotaxis response regulator CheY
MDNKKPLILVVDDDIPIQLLMQNLLREFGFTCATAGSGAEAVNVVRGGTRPDLVLLDMNMPGMTGPEAIQALRAELATTPILILSGEPVSPREIAQLGVEGAVLKPFDVPALVEKIRQHV